MNEIAPIIEREFGAILSPVRLQEIFRPAMDDALSVLQTEIVKLTPDGATGELRRSVTHTTVFGDAQITGSVFIQPDSNASVYATFVEDGRAPGKMPPWNEGTPLFKWVQRKITLEYRKRTGKVYRKTAKRDAEVLSASFLIARAIGKRGTKAQKFFERGFEIGSVKANSIIDKAIEQAFP